MGKIETLAAKLQPLLKRKMGKTAYASLLNVSIGEIEQAMSIIKEGGVDVHHPQGRTPEYDKKVGYTDNSIQVEGYYDHPPKPEEIIESHQIDTKKWKLASFWSVQKGGKWRVSALFSPLKIESDTTELFQNFLLNYKPKSTPVKRIVSNKFTNETCLIINKQDAHYNKFSVKGNNSMEDRFASVYNKTEKVLKKAGVLSNLQKVIYVLGSDLFNSESTGATSHGTPQQNIGLYDESFEAICNHEIAMIDLMLQHTNNINILYVAGNHDITVGWHLVNWLKAYYRNNKKVTIDANLAYSKYVKFSNSALMFNHGYKVKLEQLAQNFPIEFKSEWSNCDHYYCFTGDKHTELSKEIGGIKFFRLSQMSNAVSNWDDENGYSLQRGCLTAFLIEENNGITDTYREIL